MGLALLALATCSGADVLNSTIPREGYSVQRDIPYAPGPRHGLDIYVPDHLAGPAKVIVFFYGGRWQAGSKDDYRFVGQAFASRGYIAVIADYRLYPQVRFPAFVKDGAKVVAWVHAHIGEYGGDADKLVVAGHSAGAYIALMLVSDTRYVAQAGGRPEWIQGAIGLAGPYDFLPFTDADVQDIFSTGKPDDTQPIHFAHAHMPPVLLLTGDADTSVRSKNTYHLAARLRGLHDPVTVRMYPDVAHIGILLSLAQGFRDKASVLDDIDDFMKSL